jgi:hypothetical protein
VDGEGNGAHPNLGRSRFPVPLILTPRATPETATHESTNNYTMEAPPTPLYLPHSLPYPIQIQRLHLKPSSSLTKTAPLFTYSYAVKTVGKKLGDKVERESKVWESPVGGLLCKWGVKEGETLVDAAYVFTSHIYVHISLYGEEKRGQRAGADASLARAVVPSSTSKSPARTTFNSTASAHYVARISQCKSTSLPRTRGRD